QIVFALVRWLDRDEATVPAAISNSGATARDDRLLCLIPLSLEPTFQAEKAREQPTQDCRVHRNASLRDCRSAVGTARDTKCTPKERLPCPVDIRLPDNDLDVGMSLAPGAAGVRTPNMCLNTDRLQSPHGERCVLLCHKGSDHLRIVRVNRHRISNG